MFYIIDCHDYKNTQTIFLMFCLFLFKKFSIFANNFGMFLLMIFYAELLQT